MCDCYLAQLSCYKLYSYRGHFEVKGQGIGDLRLCEPNVFKEITSNLVQTGHLDSKMKWLEFGGKRSKVKVTSHTQKDFSLVNAISPKLYTDVYLDSRTN